MFGTHPELEEQAAKALGYIHFAFSRLDTDLGLALVWAHGDEKLEIRTNKVSKLSFHARLELLRKLSKDLYSNSPKIVAEYEDWINDAHSVRELRNRFFHGRWGVSSKNTVGNVLGLPTSPDQESTEFTVQELKTHCETLHSLSFRLASLRKEHPV